METENKKNAGELTQITFKLSADDRKSIQEAADSLELNVSEYCRIKCLLDENETFIAKTKVAELDKLVTILRVKLNYFKENERDPNDIVLKLTSEQRQIIEKLYSDYGSDYNFPTFEDKILGALITFTTFEAIFITSFSFKGITIAEIQNAFNPEEEEEN